MFTQLFDRLGNWNPQLLREWRGNLKPLPIALAVILSVLMQVGLVFSFSLMLPQPLDLHQLYRTTSPQLQFQISEAPFFLTVSEVKPVNIVLGGSSPEVMETQQQIKNSDRVISINNQPVPDPATLGPNASPYDLVNWANEQLGYSRSQLTVAQFEGRASLGSPVPVELYDPVTDRSYQVSLPIVGVSSYHNLFCMTVSEYDSICRFNQERGAYETNWTKWYLSIFATSTFILGGALAGIGGFMIFNDLAQEQRRGTLNFVRMSPRSPFSIVLGKILGVPAPLYLSVLVALPFHCFWGLATGLSPVGLLAFYLVFSVQLLLFYSGGFLLTLVYFGVINYQAWLCTGLGLGFGGAATLITLTYNLGNGGESLHPSFVFLWMTLFSPAMPLLYALQSSPSLDHLDLGLFLQLYIAGQPLSLAAYVLITLISCGVIIAIVFGVIDRKFHNPGTTWLPRRYSYGLTIVAHLSLLLFAVPNAIENTSWDNGKDWVFLNAVIIFAFTSLYLAVLTYALTPSRQLFLDWLRFQGKTQTTQTSLLSDIESIESPRTLQISSHKTTVMGLRSTALFVDRHSPLPALIGNLFVAEALILIWLILTRNYLNIQISMRAWLLILGSLAIFSGAAILLFLISQIFVISPFKNPQIWTMYSIVGTIAAHPIMMVTSYFYFSKVPGSWFGLLPETSVILSTLFLQSLGILGMGVLHQRQLSHAARSEWQDLLTSNQGRMPQTL
jgi:hypothetical protein